MLRWFAAVCIDTLTFLSVGGMLFVCLSCKLCGIWWVCV